MYRHSSLSIIITIIVTIALAASLLLSSSSSSFFFASASTHHDCRYVEHNFSLTYGASLISQMRTNYYPRRLNFSLNVTLSPGATIDSDYPVNITFKMTEQAASFKISPMTITVDVDSAFKPSISTLNITKAKLVPRHDKAGERELLRDALTEVTLKIGRLCGRITGPSVAAFDLFEPQIVASSHLEDVNFTQALDHCNSRGLYLPSILKETDLTRYLRPNFPTGGLGANYFLASSTENILPNWAVFCWNHDPDFDANLCSNLTDDEEYFAVYRSNGVRSFKCKIPSLNDCRNNMAEWSATSNGDEPNWNNIPSGNTTALRWVTSQDPRFLADTSPNFEARVRCMDLFMYRTFEVGVKTTYETISRSISGPSSTVSFSKRTDSRSKTEELTASPHNNSFTGSMSPSSSFSNSLLETPSKSKNTKTLSPVRTISRSKTVSQDVSPSSSLPPSASEELSPSSSHHLTATSEITHTSEVTSSNELSPSSSHASTPSSPHTETVESTLTHQLTDTKELTPPRILTSSRTRTKRLTPEKTITPPLPPPPPPPLANAIPAAAQQAVAATTTLAATMAAPAAAQTLRSMSILGTVGTAERCKLFAIGKDTFASECPKFPESLMPFLRISGGNGNQTQEDNFCNPGRRGSIIANAVLAPLCIASVAIVVGLVRQRIHRTYKSLSVLAAGRVPGITCSLVGALFADGVFASATILLSQNDVTPGDVVLAVFGMLMVIALLSTSAVCLYRALKEFKDRGNPIECIQSFMRFKKSKKEKKLEEDKKKLGDGSGGDFLDELLLVDDNHKKEKEEAAAKERKKYQLHEPTGLFWFLFGNESWGPSNNSYKPKTSTEPHPLEVVEKYRSIFATCRGLNFETEETFSKYKQARRRIATVSFFIDVSMTIIAAIGRGRAQADPCDSNGKVQILQFVISTFAFIFSLVIQAPISPMRRLAVLSADFVMFLGTITLVALGAESAKMVGRCALAAAFMSTASSLFLFIMRRIFLPLRGIEIVGAAKRSKEQKMELEGGKENNDEMMKLVKKNNTRGGNSSSDDQSSFSLNNNDNDREGSLLVVPENSNNNAIAVNRARRQRHLNDDDDDDEDQGGILSTVGNALLAPILGLAGGDGEVVFDDEDDDEIDLSGFIDSNNNNNDDYEMVDFGEDNNNNYYNANDDDDDEIILDLEDDVDASHQTGAVTTTTQNDILGELLLAEGTTETV